MNRDIFKDNTLKIESGEKLGLALSGGGLSRFVFSHWCAGADGDARASPSRGGHFYGFRRVNYWSPLLPPYKEAIGRKDRQRDKKSGLQKSDKKN